MGVLQAAIRRDANAVKFIPDSYLPKEFINQVTMVHFVKIFLRFENQFWEDSNDEELYIGHVSERRGYYPAFLIVKSIPNTMHVHVTGDLAEKILKQSETKTRNDIMDILERFIMRTFLILLILKYHTGTTTLYFLAPMRCMVPGCQQAYLRIYVSL